VTAEGPREVNRVDADRLGDLSDGHRLVAAVVNQLARTPQPAGRPRPALGAQPRGAAQQL
jgi:hypothetical protein